MLSVIPLGVGRGADGVFHARCSTSFVLVRGGKPKLLVDAGFGVIRQYQRHFSDLTCPIYISHNHSDHAAELPIIGPVIAANGHRLPLLAEHGVMKRLRKHRLHELKSTGRPLRDFFEFRAFDADEPIDLGDDLSLVAVRGGHSERSFGIVVTDGDRELLAIGADSRFDPVYYQRLATAQTVILDARHPGNAEHADFSEIEQWAARQSAARVWVTGYGQTDYSPENFSLCEPGRPISLD